MKNFVFIIGLFMITLISAQSDSIVNYDYKIYGGSPIQKGWLFSKPYYKKVYNAIIVKDSLINELQQYSILSDSLISSQKKEISVLKSKNDLRDTQIKSDSVTIKQLNSLYLEQKAESDSKISKDKYRKDIKKTSLISFGAGIVATLIGIIIVN